MTFHEIFAGLLHLYFTAWKVDLKAVACLTRAKLSGVLGALSNGVLLAIHLRLKAHLLDPTGI
jgi:hypothetical protein